MLVTGHTGFTGGWLSLWLARLGAEVHGIALPPDTTPNLFTAAGIEAVVRGRIVDIRDEAATVGAIGKIAPEIVIHLAAQALVRRGYREPAATFATNVMGTAHVLEGCRRSASVEATVMITTDKVYRNREWIWAYRENEELGGKDPYSASKSAAEHVIGAYAAAFFAAPGTAALATARGGNIIGGGDWSEDRLIPDYVRAVTRGHELVVRSPKSTRPWQHVLALCHGYLMLAAGLLAEPDRHRGAFNLGPERTASVAVEVVLERLATHWTSPTIRIEPSALAEAQLLALDSTKAQDVLGWMPPWDLEESLRRTALWYRDVLERRRDPRETCAEQIEAYRHGLLG